MPWQAAVGRLLIAGVVLASGGAGLAEARQQGNEPAPGVRLDNTSGYEWIKRLERPERLPALKVDEVIAALGLGPGMAIADIGCGTGAFTIPFARAVAPHGTAFAVDIWPELLDHVEAKAAREGNTTLKPVLARRDDPSLPEQSLDIAFFHDVFHNVNDRLDYLSRLAASLKPGGRIVIVEQEFDDPIAKQWDKPEDRITREQVRAWMATVGFELVRELDLFQGANNPEGAGMPERWFVIYQRTRDRQPSR
jgi:SAM-dependent methyltransferase